MSNWIGYDLLEALGKYSRKKTNCLSWAMFPLVAVFFKFQEKRYEIEWMFEYLAHHY